LIEREHSNDKWFDPSLSSFPWGYADADGQIITMVYAIITA
jgi:hypothetical protein